MEYLFEAELRAEAENFIRILEAIGIQGRIAPDGCRDYLVKVTIARGEMRYGNINLYYSPNKRNFSIKTHELKDKSVIPDIESAWNSRVPEVQKETGLLASAQSVSLNEFEAYVDGSFIDGPIGYGALILKDGKLVFEVGSTVDDPTLLDMRQVGGELQAVYAVIKWCKENHIHQISIFYDYEGIECWATGRWKAKNPATEAYAKFIKSCEIGITWNKVKSHSGVQWNEYVDRLAKKGSKKPETILSKQTNYLPEVYEKARSFSAVLQEENIQSNLIGVLNNQYIRFKFLPTGQMDIYCTAKRPPEEPYCSNFTDSELQRKVIALWKEFYSGYPKLVDFPQSEDTSLSEVEYYYRVLLPYRDCMFDFSNLASAIKKACQQNGCLGRFENILQNTPDFDTLENIYHQIKTEGEH